MKDKEIQKINVIITFDDSREQDWFDIWIDKKVYPRVLEEESSLVQHLLEGIKKKKNVKLYFSKKEFFKRYQKNS